MRFLTKNNIPFIRMRKIAYTISIIVILASLIGLFVRGLNWSIEFSSGVAAKVNLKAASASVEPVQIDDLRNVLKINGYPEAEIQHVGSVEDATFMIKIKSRQSEDGAATDTKTEIIDLINENFPEHVAGRDLNRDVIAEIYEVGPKVGGELRTNALMAIGISLIFMIIYIWFRFELIFGIMAIVALAHDVLVVIGVFALTGKEISVQIIAALLTIVGYSINDTIVIFDRVREDLKIRRKDPLEVIINDAINETLSRTIITALTTFIATLSLYLFGGQVLHDFALAMCIGVVVGTYSTIFVASSLIVDFTKLAHKEKKAAQKLSKRK